MRTIGCPSDPGTGVSLTSPTSPCRRPAGIGEVTSHVASHPFWRGALWALLVAAVPGGLLRCTGLELPPAWCRETRRASE